MSLYSQNLSNNPLSLDGLIVGNFDEVYINGVIVTPTDTTGLVPYTGATTTVNLNTKKITTTYTAVNTEDLTNKGFTDATYVPYTGATTTVNLNSQKITTTYVPVNDEDLANKLYNDGRYLKISGFNLSSGGFVFSGTSTVYLQSTTNITASTATPTFSLGLNSSNNLIKFAGGVGDAVLAGGTALSPQYFSGYNTFANAINTNTINNNGNYLNTGGITFAGIGLYTGTATAFLGIDSGGTVVKTTSTGIPTQLNLTNTTSNVEYYPVFVTLSSSGIQTVLNMSGLTFNPNTTILTTTKLKITNVPVGTTQYILAVDATGNVIQGTVTAGDAFLANTQTFTGINTFSNQMTLTKGFDLTLGAVNSFSVRNSSLVTQFTVTNTGVTMGNLVLTGTVFNMSSTSPNFIYSGDSLAITASATTSKSIILSVAGTGLTLDQYGASFSSATKTLTCSSIQPLTATDLNIYNPSSNINLTATTSILYGVTTGHFFSVNSVTNFAVSGDGLWMPVSGSKSLYITDTYPRTATSSYSRYFAVGGTVYQDFYNEFQWRRDPGLTGGGVTTLMTLNSNGLTLNNATGIGQPQIVFGGSGVPTIRCNGGGMNWFFASTTQMGYMDNGGYGNGGGTGTGLGWRIFGTTALTLGSGSGLYLEAPASGNATINARIRSTVSGNFPFGNNGWFYLGGAFVVSNDQVGNVSNGIGMAVSSSNNWCYISFVKPGAFWSQGIIETGNSNWYVNGSLAAYITGGGWTNVSDARCKHDIHDLSTTKSLQRILKCKPKYYKRIIEEPTGEFAIPNKQEDIDRVHIGLLAQEVQTFNPHCVSTWHDKDESKENERLGIQYNDFVIHLIGAVQEQQKQIQKQQQTIDTLLSHLAKLTEQVNQITLKMI